MSERTGTSPAVVLAARRLGFSYGRTGVLDGLSVEFRPGITGLLGPNGAGKSTLLQLLAGAETPHQGDVHYSGGSLRQADRRAEFARGLGYLPQEFGFVPGFTVRDTVTYVAWMRGVAQPEQAATMALRAVGMEALARRRLGALSGGQRRRVGIAQAVVNQPRVLLLDEPTAGLDPGQRASFRRLLQKVAEQAIVVISTHLVEDVASICSDVKILDAGAIRFEGDPRALAGMGVGIPGDDTSPLEHGYRAVLGGDAW